MTAALPIRPMNDQPLRYPVTTPRSLSSDARFLYEFLSENWPMDRFDRDVFEPGILDKFIPAAQGKAFQPTDRMEKAIEELVSMDLAVRSLGSSRVRIKRVHEYYTIATGRGSQLIRVSVIDDLALDSILLAVIVGGDLESREAIRGNPSEIVLGSRHEDATDEEHSPARTSHLVIRNPSIPAFNGHGEMSFNGVLVGANLYPFGADPLKAVDEDTGRSQQTCTECQQPHPFAPFLPPNAYWLDRPVFVHVEVLPLRPYLVAKPPMHI